MSLFAKKKKHETHAFQNANMSQFFQCEICESSAATGKGQLHHSSQQAARAGREGRKMSSSSSLWMERDRCWDRIDVLCLLTVKSTVRSAGQKPGSALAKSRSSLADWTLRDEPLVGRYQDHAICGTTIDRV